MNVREICSGSFALPLPAAAAVALFTPEGERGWAGPDWDPAYPVAGAVHDEPGTVFQTESDGGMATWIVLERRADGMRYARVAPERIAGTVDVTCTPTGPDECRVDVVYDVTSLGAEGAAFARELSAGFDAFLASWRTAILATR